MFEVQKNLDTTRDVLKKTEENLFETKEDLTLHSMVLDEHKESEEKFHNQAGKTMETLQTTLSDVGRLHQKIGIFLAIFYL